MQLVELSVILYSNKFTRPLYDKAYGKAYLWKLFFLFACKASAFPSFVAPEKLLLLYSLI